MQADRFLTRSLQDARVLRILAAALDAVDPGRLVTEYLIHAGLPLHRRLFLLGMGKAAELMVESAAKAAGEEVAGALVITKRLAAHARHDGAWVGAHSVPRTQGRNFQAVEAGHPVPDERSIHAGRLVHEFVSVLEAGDLLICLISGGASSLVVMPPEGVALEDLQALTASLLGAGVDIEEMNALRRQLDGLKGGGLARSTRASILSLILSDVIGDHVEAVASGPTAPNPTDVRDALSVLERHAVRTSPSITHALRRSSLERTPWPVDRVRNVTIGNNKLALDGACQQAMIEGFHSQVVDYGLHGEASAAGRRLAGVLRSAGQVRQRPVCLIVGGETTVRLGDHGKGGRNQELTLAAVDVLDGLPSAMLVSLATDGDDGPTDAAGAVATGGTRGQAMAMGMRPMDYLSRHDSYSFFNALGDLLKPGYTRTNVNDLILLLRL